jgi:hypothetical protein
LAVGDSLDLARQSAGSVPGTRRARATGTLERLPKWLNLVPMVLQWCWLSLRYRSLTLPSAANPAITAGGLVGDTKSEYFAGMGPAAASRVAPYAMLQVDDGALAAARIAMSKAKLGFPVVVKPDLGWCGYGVQKVDDEAALASYLTVYPAGESLMLQQYLDEPGEAGIYYLRQPGAKQGRLLGILLRQYPQVIGDGVSRLETLIREDIRAARLFADGRRHRFDGDLHRVPAAGECVRLALIGSTRVGGRYEDGSLAATPMLLDAVERIARDMPQFHVGRFDVRYASLADLHQGHFTIMEVNGAGSEAVYAWDPTYSILQAYRLVFAKQRALFALGEANRALGHAPVGALSLIRHYLRQQRLIRRYPPSN